MCGQKDGWMEGWIAKWTGGQRWHCILAKTDLTQRRETRFTEREILAQDILDLKDLSIIHGLTPIQEGLNVKSLEV